MTMTQIWVNGGGASARVTQRAATSTAPAASAAASPIHRGRRLSPAGAVNGDRRSIANRTPVHQRAETVSPRAQVASSTIGALAVLAGGTANGVKGRRPGAKDSE